MSTILTKTRMDQITETAEMLFQERGYTATSMRHLASELGIEPASLYAHIRSKEEILQSICFRMADEFFAELEAIPSEELNDRELLHAYIVSHVKVIMRNMNASAVFFNDWKFMTDPELSEFRSLRRRYEQMFYTLLETGMQNGDFKLIDLNFTCKTILSAMNLTHEWYKGEQLPDANQIGKQLAELLLNGIGGDNTNHKK